MDQNEFMQRTRRVLQRAESKVKDTVSLLEDILTDDTLSATIIGENMKKQSILDQARASVTRLEVQVRELRQKRDAAEEKLKESRKLPDPDAVITTRVSLGAGPPKLTTIKGATPAREIGVSYRDSPEYQAAVLARMELGDAHNRLTHAQSVVRKIERQASDLRALLDCVEAA